MRKLNGRLTLAFLVIVVSWLLVPSQPPAQQADVSPRQFIVSWRADTHPAEREVASMSAGGLVVHHHPFGSGSLVWLPNAAAAERLRRNPLAVQVAPNRRLFEVGARQGLCAPPKCMDCDGGAPPGDQRVPLGVGRIGAAPGFVSFTGSGVGVAVVDTGINGQHRDLIRADGTRVVSTTFFHANPVATLDMDLSLAAGGHGTKVAGVIAAVNNSVDLVGVAPESGLYNVNVFADLVECLPGETFCASDDTLLKGIEWILTNHNTVSPPIQVVNVSLGRPGNPGDNLALFNNFKELSLRSIVTAVAACNDPTLEVKDTIPAGYQTVMAIAGTTAALGSDDGSLCSIFPHVPADTASWFTTDGRFDPNTRVGVTISAPAEDREDIVRTPARCAPQSVGLLLLSSGGGLSRDAGTSYSSAHVAGVVALMKQQAAALGKTSFLPTVQDKIRSTANRLLDVPLDSTHESYTFDGEREGIVWAPGALQ